MKKPENMLKLLMHLSTLLLGGLILGFLALPVFVTKAAGNTSTTSGYDLLDFSKATDASPKFSAVMTLILVIVVCLMMVAAILALLGDFGVVENATFVKVVNFALLISAALALISAILCIIAAATYAANSDTAKALKLMGAKFSAGWAELILTTVCAAGSVGTSLVAMRK